MVGRDNSLSALLQGKAETEKKRGRGFFSSAKEGDAQYAGIIKKSASRGGEAVESTLLTDSSDNK